MRDSRAQADQNCRRRCRSKGSLCHHAYRSIDLGTRPPIPFIRWSGRPIVAVHLFPHRGPIALRVGYARQWPCIRLERLEINWQLVTFHRVASGRALERVRPSAYNDCASFLESFIAVLYLKERKAADSDSNCSTKILLTIGVIWTCRFPLSSSSVELFATGVNAIELRMKGRKPLLAWAPVTELARRRWSWDSCGAQNDRQPAKMRSSAELFVNASLHPVAARAQPYRPQSGSDAKH